MMSEQTEQGTEERNTSEVSSVETNQQTATDTENRPSTGEESTTESTPVASTTSDTTSDAATPETESEAGKAPVTDSPERESPESETQESESTVAQSPVAEMAVDDASEAESPVATNAVSDEAASDEATSQDSAPSASGQDAPAASVAQSETDAAAEPAADETEADTGASTPEQPATDASATTSATDNEQDVKQDDEQEDDAAAEPGTEVETDEDGNKRVVRILSVGQEVEGEVKRITDFGAFVDIGVGRDGLLHISELSVQRVGKVSDVLEEGQTITVWIKDLDRKRNRISLTLISPETKTIRDLEKGEIVEGTVTRIQPYGAFIDIGVGRDALLHVREMSEGYVKRPEDVVTVGETVEARIISLSRRRNRIDLSLKGLRPEPAPAAMPQEQAQEEIAGEDEDSFEDQEVLSPMELAFKRAMEAADDDDEESSGGSRRRGKGRRRSRSQSLQDEIIARTLDNRPSKK